MKPSKWLSKNDQVENFVGGLIRLGLQGMSKTVTATSPFAGLGFFMEPCFVI